MRSISARPCPTGRPEPYSEGSYGFSWNDRAAILVFSPTIIVTPRNGAGSDRVVQGQDLARAWTPICPENSWCPCRTKARPAQPRSLTGSKQGGTIKAPESSTGPMARLVLSAYELLYSGALDAVSLETALSGSRVPFRLGDFFSPQVRQKPTWRKRVEIATLSCSVTGKTQASATQQKPPAVSRRGSVDP